MLNTITGTNVSLVTFTSKLTLLQPPAYSYNKYRVILKSLRDFRPLRYSSWDGHAEGEHVNRGIDTPSFCPTLQVLDMSRCQSCNQVPATHMQRATCVAGTWLQDWHLDISSTCKVGQKLGVSLPLLTWSPSAWPSRLLYRRGRKSRRDLWITLYNINLFVTVVRHFTTSEQISGALKDKWNHINCTDGLLFLYRELRLGSSRYWNIIWKRRVRWVNNVFVEFKTRPLYVRNT